MLAVGCGGGLLDEPIHTAAVSEPASKPSLAAPARPPGVLYRDDVNHTVDEGLGYFLQRVTVEPEVIGGKFQGFRVVDLRPAEYWTSVDLMPGDVVTAVNGLPIERDIDAYQAFQGLRTASELRVTLYRGGAKRELSFAIVDRSGKGAPGKPATPKAPPGAAATTAAPQPKTPSALPAAEPPKPAGAHGGAG